MLNYEIAGSGKENLVMLHGFMENLSIWNDMEMTLSKDFKLIKIDLPGHGKSPVTSEIHTMEWMAGEVKKIADELGLGSFHLLGHSMGGYIALAYAKQFPQLLKSVTLFFSTFLADDEEKKEQRRRSIPIIENAFPQYVNAGISNLFNENEKDIILMGTKETHCLGDILLKHYSGDLNALIREGKDLHEQQLLDLDDFAYQVFDYRAENFNDRWLYVKGLSVLKYVQRTQFAAQ